jgi:hypothetical protein
MTWCLPHKGWALGAAAQLALAASTLLTLAFAPGKAGRTLATGGMCGGYAAVEAARYG